MTSTEDFLDGRHIVLLDEDRFTARMIATLLPSLGAVSLDVRLDLDDAIAAARTAPAAETIVMIDLDGEKRLGLSLLKAIRIGEAGTARDLPVLALAGRNDQNLIDLAHALDVNAILARPLSRAALHASCRRLAASGIEPRPAETYRSVAVLKV